MKKNFSVLFLLFLFLIPSLFGLFHTGLFISDDGHWMVIRLSAFYQALVSGQFPVRFLPQLNQGFGYPVADFLYPLFLYIGSLLHFIKIPFVLSIKILFGISLLGSGLGAYIWLKKQFTPIAAAVGALAYVYFPYHIYDVYSRGSMGEVLALAILPFILFFIETKQIALTSFCIGLLILSHNTLAFLFLPILILYMLLRSFSLKEVCFSMILGLGISAFFWFPALYDRQFTVFSTIHIANASAYFLTDKSIGLVGVISLILFPAVFLQRTFVKNKIGMFFWVIGVFGIFMATNTSQPLWRNDILMQFVQFPFRFLSLTVVASALLAAYLVDMFKKKIIIALIASIFLAASVFPYLLPTHYDISPDSYYSTNQDTTTVKNEYMPIWFHQEKLQRQIIESAPQNAKITLQKQKGTTISLQIESSESGQVIFGFGYFPGWVATLDGKNVHTYPSKENGLISIDVPSGVHAITIHFSDEGYRLISDIISFVSCLIIVVLIFKKYAKK